MVQTGGSIFHILYQGVVFMQTLAQLKPGQSARVLRVHGTAALRRRIMELGFTPTVEVQLRKTAPFGDPLEIRLRGYSLSLRRTEAALIEIM